VESQGIEREQGRQVNRAHALICLCIAWLPTACSSGPKTGDEPTPSAGLEILETLHASGSAHASDIYALEPGERRFATADGHEIVVRMTLSGEHGATHAISEGDERTTWIRTDDEGRIAMTAVFEADDHAISLFTPPLVIAFKDIQPGHEYTSESAMKVVDSKDSRSVRESGTATRSITYIDDQRIRIPAGEFTAMRLSVRFQADLKLAKATEDTTLWVVRERGIIARQSDEQVKVLGIGGGKHTRTLVLINDQ
jgi:hypothetical protein